MTFKIKPAVFVLTTLLIFAVAGCGSNVSQKEGSAQEASKKTPQKIICTAASNTEIVVGLGLAEKLVAVDIYSSDIEGLGEKAKLVDFYQLNVEEIISIEPDLVIASDINGTGSGDDPFAAVKNAGIEVVVVDTPKSIEELKMTITTIADVTGVPDKGQQLVSEMEQKIDDITKKVSTVEKRKTVYFEISPAPSIFTFGGDTFQSEILKLAGGDNIFSSSSAWFQPSEEAIIEANPDVIITNVSYVENAVGAIKERAGFSAIKAVADGNVFQVDSNPTSRPSQNVVKGIEQISRLLYPEIFE